MEKLNEVLNKLKEHTEEVLDCYKDKEHWDDKDLKCAKEAAELYDLLQTIQMNTGVWEGIKGSYPQEWSGARYPHISYGPNDGHMGSYARGRDANTGRYVSRGIDSMWYDERYHGMNDRMDGYSTHSVTEQAIEKLEMLMATAKDDGERRRIMEMIDTIKHQMR